MARHNHSRITVSWVGLVILIVGVILLLSNLGYINANMNDIIRDYWPVILIIIGITQIVGRDVSGGIFMIILGGVFLMVTLDKWYWHDVFDLWPLILVWIGVSMLFKTHKFQYEKSTAYGEDSRDFLDISAIFKDIRSSAASSDLRGGDIAAIFGNVILDLERVKVPQRKCRLELTSIFGDIFLTVPKTMFVSIKGTPVFGNIINQTKTPDEAERTVVIEADCTAIFGKVLIRN